jgi:Leucine-rich repeat (LRR) protein
MDKAMLKILVHYLQCINLTKNSLSMIDDLVVFKNLTKIYASMNFISTVTLDLRKLKTLVLSHNYLEEFPDL